MYKVKKPTYHTVEDIHRTAAMAHIGNIAMTLKRKLRWDPVKEEFPGDIEANSMLVRQEREPWSLKTLLA